VVPATKHLFWPNPLQLISDVSDVASLSLRLFANIAAEFVVVLLVLEVAPIGIPLVIHGLGLIPAFVQPLVFTLLTTSFLATSMRHADEHAQAAEKPDKTRKKRFHLSLGGSKG
jgi:F0F1-type ATP synthase membrane subunit a